MAQQQVRRWAKDALGAVLLFVAYFITARLGLLMDAVAGFATLVWPPTGIALGAICSTAVSAAVGVASLLLGGTITPPLSWLTFRAWWLGDMLGDLVIAPLLFVWISRPPPAW